MIREVADGVGRRATPVWRSGWDGDAVTDDNRIIGDEHLLHDESHDGLPLEHIERVGGRAQSPQKHRERFGQAQRPRPFPRLVRDRLPFGAQRLFTVPQGRHSLPEVLERQEVFLIGGQHSLDALAHAHQIALHSLFALGGGVGGTRHGEAPVQFLLDQGGIFARRITSVQTVSSKRSCRTGRVVHRGPRCRHASDPIQR
jgi:hypothetical protein